jgi:hypothetical protein
MFSKTTMMGNFDDCLNSSTDFLSSSAILSFRMAQRYWLRGKKRKGVKGRLILHHFPVYFFAFLVLNNIIISTWLTGFRLA